jgi:hypothetical protein
MLWALGMPPKSAQKGARARWRRNRGTRLGVAVGAYLALASAQCTFPDYDIKDPDGGAAGGGAVGAAGASVGGSVAAQGGTGATATLAGAGAGAGVVPVEGGAAGQGGEDTVGGSAECLPEQWPVELCEAGCLRRFPEHCYDGKASGDEVAIDCGGSCQRCTNEACTTSHDCLSHRCEGSGDASCSAPLGIRFTSHELSSSVGSTAWSITLSNDEPVGGEAFPFKGIKLRYYFARSGVVEPILVRATQANLKLLSGESRSLAQTTWTIERTEGTSDTVYDAYVEVGFDESGQFFPGDSIELYQQMLTGDPGSSSFDQRANYSFTDQSDAAWLHVTVFYDDELKWGLEPRPANPRACFAQAVNLNGPALTIDGHAFQGGSQAGVTGGTGVSQGGVPFPPVAGALATMLQTSLKATGQQSELVWPAPNGEYLLYVYATSPSNDATASAFTVQGQVPEGSNKFRAQAADGGQAWSRLGPYRESVVDGKVTVAVTSGSISFTGMELWYPE